MIRSSPTRLNSALLLLCLSVCACTSPSRADATLTPAELIKESSTLPSTPLFGCSVSNFAWGHELHGFVIDDAGRVWSFNHEKLWAGSRLARAASPFAIGGNWYQRNPLLEMYSPAESRTRLPTAVVGKYEALIEPARLGKIVMQQEAVDSGRYGCEAYFWNAAQDTYQFVDLGSDGDVSVVNESSAAHTLGIWLRTVERALKKDPRYPLRP